jgi:hypothetical protein
LKRLLWIPVVGIIAAAIGTPLDDPRAAIYFRSILVAAGLFTAIQAFLTSRNFTPNDRMFWSWVLLGAGYALAAIRYGMRLQVLITGHGVTYRPLLDAMLIIQNAFVAICLLLFVQSWRATGLATPGSRQSQMASIAAGIVAAIVVGGYPLMLGLRTVSTDTVLFVSTLGDMIGIALIVPLTMPALALRGGRLMGAWASLAASEIAWLAYDIWLALKPAMIVQPRVERTFEEIFRIAAILFAAIAAMAQRRAARA